MCLGDREMALECGVGWSGDDVSRRWQVREGFLGEQAHQSLTVADEFYGGGVLVLKDEEHTEWRQPDDQHEKILCTVIGGP